MPRQRLDRTGPYSAQCIGIGHDHLRRDTTGGRPVKSPDGVDCRNPGLVAAAVLPPQPPPRRSIALRPVPAVAARPETPWVRHSPSGAPRDARALDAAGPLPWSPVAGPRPAC